MRSDEVVESGAESGIYALAVAPAGSVAAQGLLNDELMGVLPVTKSSWGKRHGAGTYQSLFITDFNRVRLEFVGHYRDRV